MGTFSGRLFVEVQAEHPDIFSGPPSLEWYFRVPGSETFEAMRARVVPFLDEVGRRRSSCATA